MTVQATSPKKENNGLRILSTVLLVAFFTVLAILIIIPLWALLLGTFKGGAELFISGLNLSIQPEKLHLKAWKYLFTGIMSDGTYGPHDYFLWYKNSLFIVAIQGVLTLLASSWVAYGFSKYNFKGKNVLFL